MSNGISLGTLIDRGDQARTNRIITDTARKAAEGEGRRKGISNLFKALKKIGTKLLPLGAEQVVDTVLDAFIDSASRGDWGKMLKTPGQIDEVKSTSLFGYGGEDAKSITEELQKSRKIDPFGQRLLENIALDTVSSFTEGGLDDIFKDVGEKFQTGLENTVNTVNFKENAKDFFSNNPLSNLTRTWSMNPKKYYGGGQVNGNPTISGYFEQQGKTLGGSNKQSLAEMLGRK